MTMKKFFSVNDPLERKRMLRNYSQEARRNMMFSARRKTRKSFEWLVFYAENLPNVNDKPDFNPDQEFSRVFNQKVLLDWSKIGEALKKGAFYTNNKMLTQDQILKLSSDLSAENIEHEPLRLYRDSKYRYKMSQELFLKKPWKKTEIIDRMLSGEIIKFPDYKDANFS